VIDSRERAVRRLNFEDWFYGPPNNDEANLEELDHELSVFDFVEQDVKE
jgi:hypothetical protein